MPQGNGLGYISENIKDLFRPLDGKLALKDPAELKPEYRVRKCVYEVPEELAPIPQQFWSIDNRNLTLAKDLSSWCPAGVLNIKVRLADESVSVADVVRGPFMKWAIAEALAEAIFSLTGVQFNPSEQLLFCMEEVKILDVQMPYNGAQVWQFCDFRFDYMLDINSVDATTAVESVWYEMAVFERLFCKALETQFRDIYHLTVLNLIDKKYALTDGTQLHSGKQLFEAACRNDVEAIQSLLQASAIDVNWKPKECSYPTGILDEEFRMMWVSLGRTALLGAAEEGHVEAMTSLLDAKADVNFQDNSGFHALYLGAGAEDAEKVVKFLLTRGANVNLKNKSGYTPLHNACGCGETGAIQALLEAKANLSMRSNVGSAPIHVAVLNNQPDSLVTLARLGANLDMPAFGGNTPIHEGVMQNNPSIIQKLVELKANMNIESGPEHRFATPLKMARDRKKKKAAKILESLGALEQIEGHEYDDGEFEKDAEGNLVPRVSGRYTELAAASTS